MKTIKQNIQRLVGVAILAAIIIVLQTVTGSISIGPFTITLSLIPIILGAILFGPASGAALGAIFGAFVCISVVTGADIGGHIMFQQLPVLTLFLCVLKSTVAGFVTGIVWKLLKANNRPRLGVILSAIVCPVCNTGILCIGILTFFYDLATQWAVEWAATTEWAADMANAFAYVIFGMVGINFILELAINLALIPALLSIVKAVQKKLA